MTEVALVPQKCSDCDKEFEGKWRGCMCYPCSMESLERERAAITRALNSLQKKMEKK